MAAKKKSAKKKAARKKGALRTLINHVMEKPKSEPLVSSITIPEPERAKPDPVIKRKRR